MKTTSKSQQRTRQQKLGQFLTATPTADFMASWGVGFLLLLAISCAKAPVYEKWCDEWQIMVRDALTGNGAVSASYEGAWRPQEMTPDKYGNRPYYEAVGAHIGILEVHPVSPTEPAKMKLKGVVASQTPFLTVLAGGSIHGDCVLQCRVNGERVGEYVLNGLQWTSCVFDLTSIANQAADIQLWICAGGEKLWNYENCFIDSITFASERPKSLSRTQ